MTPDPGKSDDSTCGEEPVIHSDLSFEVVGLGAAAGGIDALTRFFEAMPADSGMAFVVVLLLSARHESDLEELLRRVTTMPVRRASDRLPIEPDHVYVVSPSMHVTMSDGHLRVTASEQTNGKWSALDAFMCTLGEAHGDQAVAAILSGSGTDGAVGIARVRECGGITFAQSAADAQQPGMPRSAVLTGSIDFVLPVTAIAAKMRELSLHAKRLRSFASSEDALPRSTVRAPRSVDDEQALRAIIALVRRRTRHDFEHYERGTLLRRLQRRLQIHALADLTSYLAHLRDDAGEAVQLVQDLLVSVTSFFRDRTAYAVFEEALPAMLGDRDLTRPMRVWVVGCASGEEAYSVAMLMHELLDAATDSPALQIFATDTDEQAIAFARAGAYPATISADVSPARLRRFFVEDGDRYRVSQLLRETVLFATHNVLRDPPFSQIDVLCCRHLLVYLERTMRAKASDTFGFSLKPGGLLFLGSSESFEERSSQMSPIDWKHGLFRAVGRPKFALPAVNVALQGADWSGASRAATEPDSATIHRQAIERGAEPSVLVDRDFRTAHVSSGAERYLLHPAGAPSPQLLDNVLPSLRSAVRAVLSEAARTGADAEKRDVRFVQDGARASIGVRVAVTQASAESKAHYLITFSGRANVADAEPLSEADRDRLLAQLQDSVNASEASVQELRASREELQTANEELRTAGEELESGKEELQSMNEELSTVNAELHVRLDEIATTNDDLRNLMTSSDIATVFVDRVMRIKRFTPKAADVFHLIESDVGRPLTHINHRVEYPELPQDVASAFSALRTSERRVTSRDGLHFLVRVLPYRTFDNKIEGAVITCVDVTALHRAEERARTSEEHLRLAVESSFDYAIFTCDEVGTVSTWNAGAQRIFGYSDLEMIGKPVSLLFTIEDRAKGAPRQELEQARLQGRAEDERWHLRKDGSLVYLSGVMIPLLRDGLLGFSKIARDTTLAIEAEAGREAMLVAEQATSARFEADNRLKDELLAVMSHELKHPLNLILVHLDLLMQLGADAFDTRGVRAAEIIRGAVVGQGKVIDDLLDLSRVRTGKLALELAPVDLAAAVEAIIESTAREARDKGIDVEYSVKPRVRRVLADPVRVNQIVWNLVSNALKFTSEGGWVRIEVSEGGDRGLLTVTDNGKGIAPEFLPHVFDMFSQAGRGPSRERGGLGIGLALVREIVAGLDGRVAAASDGLGLGATFQVWLPFAIEERAGGATVAPSLTLDGLRVLMVDDSSESLAAFVELLRIDGALPVAAANGHVALRIAETQRFDVVISDLAMPGLDGYALMRELRRRPATKDIIAIALTGFGRERDKIAALEAGFDTHVGKPASIRDIHQALARLGVRRRPDSHD